jgi:predicted nucleotidyltransferase component of viral defense system
MYDFQLQKEMLDISLALLEERGVKADCALGGGTALSAYYWQHRFSTDIDIFIHNGTKEDLNRIDPRRTSAGIKVQLKKINYRGDLKKHPIYTELAIDDDSKMQFFVVKGHTTIPYSKVILWNKQIFVESIEEIIAKKVYYRCEDANARDLFDLAVAIYKDPSILMSINVAKEKLEKLLVSVETIAESKELTNTYKLEIKMMSPAAEYTDIAMNCITYLNTFLSNYLSALNQRMPNMKEFCEELQEYSYSL